MCHPDRREGSRSQSARCFAALNMTPKVTPCPSGASHAALTCPCETSERSKQSAPIAVGMPLPIFVPLIQPGFQVTLSFYLHGRIDHRADQLWQVVQSIFSNPFHNFCRKFKIILVGMMLFLFDVVTVKTI